MSKNVYCGIGPVPKNSRLGSMKECADKKQIRYYGIKKVDPKLVEVAIGNENNKGEREKVFKEIAKNKGKVKKLRDKISATKEKNKKDELQKELVKLVETTNALVRKFQTLDKAQRRSSSSRSRSQNSRTRSRSRNSRNGSRRSRSSRSREVSRSRSRSISRY